MICGDCWIYADNPFCTLESHESVQKLIKSEQKSDFFHQNCLLFDSDMDNTNTSEGDWRSPQPEDSP